MEKHQGMAIPKSGCCSQGSIVSSVFTAIALSDPKHCEFHLEVPNFLALIQRLSVYLSQDRELYDCKTESPQVSPKSEVQPFILYLLLICVHFSPA